MGLRPRYTQPVRRYLGPAGGVRLSSGRFERLLPVGGGVRCAPGISEVADYGGLATDDRSFAVVGLAVIAATPNGLRSVDAVATDANSWRRARAAENDRSTSDGNGKSRSAAAESGQQNHAQTSK